MPIFMIERRYAAAFEPTIDAAEGVNRINDEEEVRWLYSFLSADRRKTSCLYEAVSETAIRRAAERAGTRSEDHGSPSSTCSEPWAKAERQASTGPSNGW